MKSRTMILIVACSMGLFSWNTAQAETLDFELGLTSGWTRLTDYAPNYAGFTWSTGLWLYQETSMDTDYGIPPYPSHDEAVAVFSFATLDNYSTVTIDTNAPIELNGAWFAAMYPPTYGANYSSSTITIRGYLGASLVGTASGAINHYSFTHIETNFASPVDKFTITGSGGLYNYQYWVMDNLEYVPEPSTALLLAFGLAGLAVSRRKSKRGKILEKGALLILPSRRVGNQ